MNIPNDQFHDKTYYYIISPLKLMRNYTTVNAFGKWKCLHKWKARFGTKLK